MDRVAIPDTFRFPREPSFARQYDPADHRFTEPGLQIVWTVSGGGGGPSWPLWTRASNQAFASLPSCKFPGCVRTDIGRISDGYRTDI